MKPTTIVSLIERFSESIGKATAWLSIILVLLVCYDVVGRYLFNTSSVAIQELEWHIFAVMFLFGATYTLKHDKHVRVDIFYSRLSNRNKAVINLLGIILFLIPFCSIVFVTSLEFVFNSFKVLESSPDPGGLPARYLLKAVLPLSFLFLLLQGMALGLKSVLVLFPKLERSVS